jgi:hypothetical protein
MKRVAQRGVDFAFHENDIALFTAGSWKQFVDDFDDLNAGFHCGCKCVNASPVAGERSEFIGHPSWKARQIFITKVPIQIDRN